MCRLRAWSSATENVRRSTIASPNPMGSQTPPTVTARAVAISPQRKRSAMLLLQRRGKSLKSAIVTTKSLNVRAFLPKEKIKRKAIVARQNINIYGGNINAYLLLALNLHQLSR
jgi:hypothetical protein